MKQRLACEHIGEMELPELEVSLQRSGGVCGLVGARRRWGVRGGVGSGRWLERRGWMPLLLGFWMFNRS